MGGNEASTKDEFRRVKFRTWKDQIIRFGPLKSPDKRCTALGFILTPSLINGKRVDRYLAIGFSCPKDILIAELQLQLPGVRMVREMEKPHGAIQRRCSPSSGIRFTKPFWSPKNPSANEYRRMTQGM